MWAVWGCVMATIYCVFTGKHQEALEFLALTFILDSRIHVIRTEKKMNQFIHGARTKFTKIEQKIAAKKEWVGGDL